MSLSWSPLLYSHGPFCRGPLALLQLAGQQAFATPPSSPRAKADVGGEFDTSRLPPTSSPSSSLSSSASASPSHSPPSTPLKHPGGKRLATQLTLPPPFRLGEFSTDSTPVEKHVTVQLTPSPQYRKEDARLSKKYAPTDERMSAQLTPPLPFQFNKEDAPTEKRMSAQLAQPPPIRLSKEDAPTHERMSVQLTPPTLRLSKEDGGLVERRLSSVQLAPPLPFGLSKEDGLVETQALCEGMNAAVDDVQTVAGALDLSIRFDRDFQQHIGKTPYYRALFRFSHKFNNQKQMESLSRLAEKHLPDQIPYKLWLFRMELEEFSGHYLQASQMARLAKTPPHLRWRIALHLARLAAAQQQWHAAQAHVAQAIARSNLHVTPTSISSSKPATRSQIMGGPADPSRGKCKRTASVKPHLLVEIAKLLQLRGNFKRAQIVLRIAHLKYGASPHRSAKANHSKDKSPDEKSAKEKGVGERCATEKGVGERCATEKGVGDKSWKVEFYWMECLMGVRDLAGARHVAFRALRRFPDNGRLWTMAIELFLQSSDTSRAEVMRLYGHAIKLVPKSGELAALGAKLHLDPTDTANFDLDAAERFAHSAIELTPQCLDGHVERLRVRSLRRITTNCSARDALGVLPPAASSYGQLWTPARPAPTKGVPNALDSVWLRLRRAQQLIDSDLTHNLLTYRQALKSNIVVQNNLVCPSAYIHHPDRIHPQVPQLTHPQRFIFLFDSPTSIHSLSTS